VLNSHENLQFWQIAQPLLFNGICPVMYLKKNYKPQLQHNKYKTATTKQTTKRQLPNSNYKTNYKTAYAHLCTTKTNYKKSNFKTATTSKQQRQNKLSNCNYHTVTTKQTTNRHMPIYVLPKKKLQNLTTNRLPGGNYQTVTTK